MLLFGRLLGATRAVGPELYFPEDEHWNRAGYAFAAREIAALIEEKGLIPVE